MEERPDLYASEGRESAIRAPLRAGEPAVAPRAAAGFQGGALAALRALHHALARASAEGQSEYALSALVANLSGRAWSEAECARLATSPAFRELVASYKRAA